MGETSLCPPPAEADQAMARPTLGQIFRQYGPAYRAKHAPRMSREQLRVMGQLARCRTGQLGHAVYRCDACGTYRILPQSCGNRHCPLCQGHKAKQWLEQQLEKLLPCAYFLITFTLPQELRPFARAHPRECYRAMFHAAAATLRELATNPKYVGSNRLGFTGVLHTWGRDLSYHPHVHFIVPGGALSEDGQQWLPSRVDFFVPVQAASTIYRAKFLDCLATSGLADEAREAVGNKKWVVHSKAVGDGRQALHYLAPYVYRVAISNRRLVQCEPGPDGLGRVTFTYRKSGSRRLRAMTVTAEEFIRRFLQHVLPSGFQKVRHYGFAHARQRIDREWLKMLVTVTLNSVYVLFVAAKPLPVAHPPICPDCGAEMIYLDFIPPAAGTLRYQLNQAKPYGPRPRLTPKGGAGEIHFRRLPTPPTLTVRSGSENRRSLPAPNFTHTPK